VDNELEVIHHEMEATRASLADKLDTLENQVLGTVHDATAAVAHTVEDVKSVVGSVTDSIQDTVESVKDTLNLSEQVRQHPWGMLGGAAAVGFLGGWLMGPSRKEPEVPPLSGPPRESYIAPVREKLAESSSGSEESAFAEPVKALKGIALGALMGLVRDMAVKALPENVKDDVVKVLNDFTTKIGGKLVEPAAEESEQCELSAEVKTSNGKRGTEEASMPGEANPGDGKEAAGQTGRKRGGARFR